MNYIFWMLTVYETYYSICLLIITKNCSQHGQNKIKNRQLHIYTIYIYIYKYIQWKVFRPLTFLTMWYFSFSFLINLQKCQQFCVFLSILGAVCTLMRKKMNLNDFSKWLQYNKEWNIWSEYFPYPLYIYIFVNHYLWQCAKVNQSLKILDNLAFVMTWHG